MKINLVPLPIATGWIVHHNAFFDEPPCLPNGDENPKHNDSEDILWLERLDFTTLAHYVVRIAQANNRLNAQELAFSQAAWAGKEEQPIDSDTHFHLDLGWYGQDRRTGRYRLVLHQGWDNIRYRFESASLEEIRQKLEIILEHLYRVSDIGILL